MNIDRNNYEEYFLLYADNELTDSEKVEIIMFLKDNKDLEEEFNMINYTVSRPDTSVGIPDKSFFLKKIEEPFITQRNYEEIFVLYHDNELTNEQKVVTQKFLTQHPQLKEEFDLIGLARLTPESYIVFPSKEDLYKKEKDGKVIPLLWKLMAAAVFIGFGLWMLQTYFNTKKEIPTALVPQKKVTSPVKNIVPEKKESNPVVQSSTQNSPPVSPVVNHNKKLQKPLLNKNVNRLVVKASIKNIRPVKQKIDVPMEKENDNIAITGNEIKSISAEQIKTDDKVSSQNQLVQNAIQKPGETLPEVAYAQPASYIQDANTNNDNYVFYDITTSEFKKSKVGGFLKKVKRVIERNNPISRLIGGQDRQVASN
jgi:cytoskeletal protein RodZ